MPDGFGHFRNALVLRDLVCVDCNRYFGESLDRALARESVEGLERYRSGIKQSSEITRFRATAVTLRAHDAGEFSGAEIRIGPGESEGEFEAEILASAAIHRASGDDYALFSEAQLLDGSWKSDEVDAGKGVRLFGPDEATVRMRNALEAQGLNLNYRPLVPPSIPIPAVLEEYSIPPALLRAVAKIAFNYLAYRSGAEFVLMAAFDSIRAFVRAGTEPPLAAVHVSNDLPFRTGRPSEERPLVHFLAIDGHESHRNLLGIVTLFGYHGYTVILAEDFAGPWPELPLAHLYNVKTRTVSEMKSQRPVWRRR